MKYPGNLQILVANNVNKSTSFSQRPPKRIIFPTVLFYLPHQNLNPLVLLPISFMHIFIPISSCVCWFLSLQDARHPKLSSAAVFVKKLHDLAGKFDVC